MFAKWQLSNLLCNVVLVRRGNGKDLLSYYVKIFMNSGYAFIVSMHLKACAYLIHIYSYYLPTANGKNIPEIMSITFVFLSVLLSCMKHMSHKRLNILSACPGCRLQIIESYLKSFCWMNQRNIKQNAILR